MAMAEVENIGGCGYVAQGFVSDSAIEWAGRARVDAAAPA